MNAEDALQKLPGQIRQLELDLFKHKRGLDGLRLRVRLREADIAEAIVKETLPAAEGEKPKLRYPNADARDVALQRAVQHDPETLAAKRSLLEEELVIARMTAVLDYHRDVQRNARVLVLARSPSTILFDDPEIAL
jgi:hypothetical protein